MPMNNNFYIIAHNIRSLYNIGTMFRTADALGVDQLFLTGYSGQPPRKEITKDSALVRELHVYGSTTPLGEEGKIQHKGIGKALLQRDFTRDFA